jgi:hypothetical protein
MKITEEEHRVYMSYTCGGGFSSQERNYAILNERRTTKNSRSSQRSHYYKIKR